MNTEGVEVVTMLTLFPFCAFNTLKTASVSAFVGSAMVYTGSGDIIVACSCGTQVEVMSRVVVVGQEVDLDLTRYHRASRWLNL